MAGRVTVKPGNKLKRIQKRLENPKEALAQIGALMVAESQAAFKEQRFNGKEWPARGPVNVYGILADLAAGKKPPKRRLETRPALRDTGRLAASISFRVVGSNVVEVGTTVEYAAVHQKGGKVKSVPLTDDLIGKVNKWLKKQAKSVKAAMGFVFARKFRGRPLEGEVPARPFIGLTKATRKYVEKTMKIKIMEVR